MNVGENIRYIREKRNLTQAYVATQAGISQAMLCQIERGTKNPSLQVGKEIANTLGCDLERLLAEEQRDYEIELSEVTPEAGLETIPEAEKMKALWYIEQNPEKKAIEIRPGSDGCISLYGVQEVKHFIKVLEETIQQMF